MAASFPRLTVLIFPEVVFSGIYLVDRFLDIIRFDLVCEDYWYWYYKYLTMENDGSFVPQAYDVDISWSIIFRNLFGRRLLDIIRFDSGLWRLLVLILQIFNDGERWQLRSPGLRCWYFLKYYFPVCICQIAWYNKIWSGLWR